MNLEAIVVSHGAPELLRRCLASLRERPSAGGTVVDSGSPAVGALRHLRRAGLGSS